ncbi:hypothetical protein [Bacillus safensis]|uniref:hypothetical protein n=1 Tax=Bacillus safensis TaxID=561879 RepID=UPI002E1F8CAD|nr:hypothetical protein [Bacillus safensis]
MVPFFKSKKIIKRTNKLISKKRIRRILLTAFKEFTSVYACPEMIEPKRGEKLERMVLVRSSMTCNKTAWIGGVTGEQSHMTIYDKIKKGEI